MNIEKLKKIVLRIALAIFSLALLFVSIDYLRDVFVNVSIKDLVHSVRHISVLKLSLVLVLVLINYFIMMGYDYFGLRYSGSKLPFKKILQASFVGDLMNANLGFSALVGSFVKLRFYTFWGEKFTVIMRAIAIYTVAYWLGFSTLTSITLLFSNVSDIVILPFFRIPLALLFSIPVILYIWFVLRRKSCLHVGKFKIEVPSVSTGIGLLITGIADWTCTSLIFYLIMPGFNINFLKFAFSYIWAHVAGMASQLPGGIAVFESAVVMLQGGIADTAIAGSLLLFRMTFFLLPFSIAITLFAIFEIKNLLSKTDPQKTIGRPVQENAIRYPSITVVVPAYNEGDSIADCLTALQNQNYKGVFEIVVVDNNSTDTTASLAISNGCTVIKEHNQGYNYAVKRGFDEARGEIIACTDADTTVPPDWLSRIADILITNKKAVACSGSFSFRDGPGWLRAIGFFGRLNYHLAGANMAVRCDAYKRCGGFSVKINQGADVDLGMRLKKIGKVIIKPSLVVATSSRRFQFAFWETIVRYYLNDAALLITGKPIFYGFKDYRISRLKSIKRPWRISFVSSLILILCVSWFLESPSNQILGTVFAGAEGTDIIDATPMIALTFDDGPGNITDSILTILKKYNARATFFVIGKNCAENPELLMSINDNGHEIGNHTMNHRFTTAVDFQKQLHAELDSASQVIESICGVKTKLFRPPHGWRSPWMIKECNRMNYSVVTWTLDSGDWYTFNSDMIVRNITKNAKTGMIILFHERNNLGSDKLTGTMLDALPKLLGQLSADGYRFVTISELMNSHVTNMARNINN
jgi:peptidoglycan/xylan/chitin deacetylase (PgdA/CDA1 family)/uncharacterized membrane protein YbhN (UPF0104 family)/GT2 family glycosyltransferase